MQNYYPEMACQVHNQIRSYVCIECPNDALLCNHCSLNHRNHKIMPWDSFVNKMKHLIDYDALPLKVYDEQPFLSLNNILVNLINQTKDLWEYLRKKKLELDQTMDRSAHCYNDMKVLHKFVSDCESCQPENVGNIVRRYVVDGEIKLVYGDTLQMPKMNYVKTFVVTQQNQITEAIQLLKISLDSLDIYDRFNKQELKQQQISNGNKIKTNTQVIDRRNKKIREKVIRKQGLKQEDYNQNTNGQLEISNRAEKTANFGSLKLCFLELAYPKLEKVKGHSLKAFQQCLLCKCNPKFYKVQPFTYKAKSYGPTYGPIELNQAQLTKMKDSFRNRKDQDILFDQNRIYLHDMYLKLRKQNIRCVYWSNFVLSDEGQGTVNLDSLIDAVATSQTLQCFLCKHKGPTLKCNSQGCLTWVHYRCFKDLELSSQKLDTQKFRILCPKHVPADYEKPRWPQLSLGL